MPRHELTSLSPFKAFKGGVGGGMGSHRYYQHAEIPIPTPALPLKGREISLVRLGGLRRARLKLAPDFHAPMTDDDLLGA